MSQETAKKALTFPPLTGHNYTSFVAKVLSRLNDRDNGLRAISTLSEPIVDDATYHAMSDTVKKKHPKDDAAIMRIVEDLINMDNGYLTAPFFSCRNFNLNGNAPPGSFPDWWASRGRRGWDRLEQKFAPKDAGDVISADSAPQCLASSCSTTGATRQPSSRSWSCAAPSISMLHRLHAPPRILSWTWLLASKRQREAMGAPGSLSGMRVNFMGTPSFRS
jgi:hypothetical protein